MSIDSIPFIPDMPSEIRDAIDNKRLILFIGSGVSQAAGLPSWHDLAMASIEEALGDDHYAELNAIKSKRFEAKHLLSLASEYHGNSFRDNICKILDKRPNKEGEELIKIIKSWDASIITTNYDDIIERIGPEYDVYYHVFGNEPNPEQLFKKRFIIHIHGSVKEPENMVLTEIDYHKLYYDLEGRKKISSLMNKIFDDTNNVILFIGSGLSEQELLQFMISRPGKQRFFNLMGFLGSDIHLCNHMIRLYQSMNIRLIPYCMDSKGHGQLIEIVRRWDEVIRSETLHTSAIVSELSKYLTTEPTDEIKKRVKQIFDADSSSILSFCLMIGGDYSKEWCEFLMDSFSIDYLVSLSKEHPDFLRTYVYKIYCVFKYLDDEQFRRVVKYYLLELMDSIYDRNLRFSILSNVCDIEISNPIVKDERILKIVKDVYNNESESYHVNSILIGEIDGYNSSNADDLLWLVRMILTAIVRKKDEGDYENYLHINIDDEFTQEFFLQLRPDIIGRLFEFVLKIFIDYSENYFFAAELGSVRELESRGDLGADLHICLWLSATIRYSNPNNLEAILTFLESDHHARSTMALNAINIHWKYLSHCLLELTDFNNLNYSELYDLILQNKDKFSEEDKQRIIALVDSSSFKLEDEQAIRVFREDLKAVLNNEKSQMPELEGLPYPKDRGKLFNVTVRGFVRDKELPNDFDDFKSILFTGEAINHPGHDPIDIVENYLNLKGELVVENLESLIVNNLTMQLIMARFLSNKTESKPKIFAFFNSLIQFKLEQHSLEYNLLRYFEIWVRLNPDCKKQSAELFRSIVEKSVDDCINTNHDGYYSDWFETCFNDWYFLSMTDYIIFSDKDSRDVDMIATLLVRVLQSPNTYASSISLSFCICYFDLLSNNKEFVENVQKGLSDHPNRLDIIESHLKYERLSQTVNRWVNDGDLFNLIIDDYRKENKNIDAALSRLGFLTSFFFNQDDYYFSNLQKGIASGRYNFLKGIIQFIQNSFKHDIDVTKILDVLSEVELDKEMSVTTMDMLHLFSETGVYEPKLLGFMIKLYSCNASFIWMDDWKFIQMVYTINPNCALDMMVVVAENKNITFYDDDILFNMVKCMATDNKNDLRVRRIVNGLIRNNHLTRYRDLL